MCKSSSLLLFLLANVCFSECLLAVDANAPTAVGSASTWPAFRGPTGQGLVDTSLPTKWSEEENHLENVAWKCSIPGKGWSSPVASGGHIWMTTAVEHETTDTEKEELLKDEKKPKQRQVAKTVSLRAVCVDAETGKVLHDIELLSVENPDPIHLLNSYASPTPVLEEHAEGDRLYCHFGTFGTTCLNTKSGEKIWEKRFPSQHAVGPGSSPILWEDLLVLVCDGMEAQYVIALHKDSGEVAWKTDRPPMEGDDGDFHKAFSTPLVSHEGGYGSKTQLLVPGAQWFVAYEARTGEMVWHINHGKGFSNVAAPVHRNGVAYLITGFTKPELWAIPINSRGELKVGNVLWEQKKQIPKKSSPVIAGNAIYVISDNGVLSCVDGDSGEIHWVKRLGGNYSASPIATSNGLVYFCSHEGKTTVVRANAEKYEEVAENKLDGQLMASPIAVNGSLYLRSDKHLYRIQ